MQGGLRGATGPEPRVSTGIPALDTILAGGLMPRRPYLVVGASGTGKTTLALQFLCEGVRRGERVLVVTLEEPPNEIRYNHRALAPELDQVHVFDAIPDVMRYERAPFKDIAAVREAIPFAQIPMSIRKTPELSSVEVTFTALEQTLKMEVARRTYSRIVIDSLTALQYFCMKGVDETVGAQTFLRFLSDLKVTTLLTVEAPLEDIETPERLLARGEIRLFRWELEGRTVRAIGVEKLRGSTHDIRLHPYRISPRGLDINLDVTISRDSRRIIEAVPPSPLLAPQGGTFSPILENVGELEQEVHDIVAVGLNFPALREAIGDVATVVALRPPDEAMHEYQRLRTLVHERAEQFRVTYPVQPPSEPPEVATAARRLLARAADARAGVPPVLANQLAQIADRLMALRDSVPAVGALLPRAPAPRDLGPSAPSTRAGVPTLVPAPPLIVEPRPAPAAVPPSSPGPSPPSPPPTSLETSRQGPSPTSPVAAVAPPPPPPPSPPVPGPDAVPANLRPAGGSAPSPGRDTEPPTGPPPLPAPSDSPSVPTPPTPPIPEGPTSRAGNVESPGAGNAAAPTPAEVSGPARSGPPEGARPALPEVAPPSLPPPVPEVALEAIPVPEPVPPAAAPPAGTEAPSTAPAKRRRRMSSSPSVKRKRPTAGAEAMGGNPVPAEAPPAGTASGEPSGEGATETGASGEKPKRRSPRRRRANVEPSGAPPSTDDAEPTERSGPPPSPPPGESGATVPAPEPNPPSAPPSEGGSA